MAQEFVPLELIKNHLNIEQDFKSEDSYLLHLRDAAFLVVQNHVCTDIAKLNGHKKAVELACLFLIATWYFQRESIGTSSMKECPHTLEFILAQYKNYNG